MSTTDEIQLRILLQGIAESLDIPPSKYQQAVERYTAVGDWLKVPGTGLAPYAPIVYAQGSLRLGTIVRPLKEGKEADYDVDLVCQLTCDKSIITPERVKTSVGARLKENAKYKEMLDKEGKRCWTLKYAEEDGVGFHLDALPSIPEPITFRTTLVQTGVPWNLAKHAVAITDNDKKTNTYAWTSSNPKGYAEWFDTVKAQSLTLIEQPERRRLFLANQSLYATEQSVPMELIRTPLQRAIQLLKRHRDMRFIGHEREKEKPISVIITTLAARAYQGEPDVLAALVGILDRITSGFGKKFIETRNGKWWIPNPVNPAENFADRWNEPGSKRAETFHQWIIWAKEDLQTAGELGLWDDQVELLSEAFGRDHVTRAVSQIERRKLPIHQVAGDVPALADHGHCLRPSWPLPAVLPNHVKVTGTVHSKKHSSRALWRFSERPIPKGVYLCFKASTNTPPPYTVKWQVVNTGSEARNAGPMQLRGGFDDGDEQWGTERWEHTMYKGTHWIEAFVIKNGVCVAKSGQVYVRIH